jgi:uncharacterized LabA/DUF88 family protein
MIKKEKIYAFIDINNLYLAIKDLGWKIDFERFAIYLKDKYKVSEIYAFIGYVLGNESLYTALQKKGYIVIFKPTLISENGQIKGNCDGELILHCMIEYNNFDKAIIISGDGDFHCLIEYLEEQNKLLKVGIPNKRKFSALLKRFRQHFFFICDLKFKLEYKKRQRVD